MAILVKSAQRINPSDEEAPKKWYITQVTTVQVDEAEVAMELADETTLNPSEVMMIIRQLRRTLLRRLLGDESVKLGNWSSFSVTLSSLGVLTKEEVNARDIRSVNPNFQPDKAFKTGLQKTTLAWVDKLAGERSGSSGGSDSESPGEIQARMVATGRYPGRYSRVPAQIPAFCCPDASGCPYSYVLALMYLRPYIYVSTFSYLYGYMDADTWIQECNRTDTSREDAGQISNRGRGVGAVPVGLWLVMGSEIIILIK